jgi:hypothetical protein
VVAIGIPEVPIQADLIGPIYDRDVDVQVGLDGRGDLAATIYRQLRDAVSTAGCGQGRGRRPELSQR